MPDRIEALRYKLSIIEALHRDGMIDTPQALAMIDEVDLEIDVLNVSLDSREVVFH